MFKVRTALLWLSFSDALSIASSVLDGGHWMRANIRWLGEKTLKEICIPGTHNSGMSKLFGGTSFAKPCNSVNQGRNIRRQLELGIRFFDVRPVISGGTYKTGHYGKILGGVWQGGNGHSIASIVNNINMFIKDHNELIFIRLSHSLNTDLGQREYRPFNQAEWNNLFIILDKTTDMYQAEGQEDIYLPEITLEEFIKNGTAPAVIYFVDENVELGVHAGKGFFSRRSLLLYDQYSETDKTNLLYMDQISKMKKFSPHRYFLLSWTLTLQPFDAAMCPTLGKGIKDLAMIANRRLRTIMSQVTMDSYPNIVSVDYVEDNEIVEVVMAINLKLLSKSLLGS